VSEWQRGWRTVAGAAVGLGTGVGLYLMVMSLFIVHITGAFGWTRGQMGLAGTVAFITGAFSLPVVGRLVDRVGFRRILLVCVPAYALFFLMVASQSGYYPFHLVLMVWGGVFGAGTSGIVYTRPVIAAFQQRRGMALGLATAGSSVSAMVVPFVLSAVIAAYGWRAGLYAMSAITGLVGFPLAFALMGRAREQTARATDELSDVARASAVQAGSAGVTLREAMRGPRFWLLALALAAVNIPGSGVVAQLAPLLSDKGLAEGTVALVMSIYAAGLLAGRLVTGAALDRVPAWTVAAVITFIPAIGMALLRVPSSSAALAASAVAMIGLQQGSEVDLVAYLVSGNFGVTHYGAIYGAVGVAGAVATAVSFVFFGRVHDLTGSYDIALALGVGGFCLGAVAFVASSRVR
jgi:MFS family permease